MTLEDDLKDELATWQSADVERALLIIAGCNDWDKLSEYKEKIGQLDAKFKQHLKDSGLENSENEKEKAYALHRFLWNRNPRKNYLLARTEDILLRTISLLPPFSLLMVRLSMIKYKNEEHKLSNVADNYINEKLKTGNCLGLTGIYTALALRNGINADVVSQPGHILSSIESNGRTLLIENTEKYGFDSKVHKLQRWKRAGLNTLIASAALSSAKDAPNNENNPYGKIKRFADPEYCKKDYDRQSKWQGFLEKASKIFKKKDSLTEEQRIADNYYERGNWLSEYCQPIRAIEDYTKAIENDDKHFAAFCERGREKLKIGNLEGALTDLTQALALNPIYPMAALNRGIARMKKRDFAGAVEDYTTLINFSKNPIPEYYIKRGRAYRAMDEFGLSTEDFKKAEDMQNEIASIDLLKSEYQ